MGLLLKRKPKLLRKLRNRERRAAKALSDATDGSAGELQHHWNMRNDPPQKRRQDQPPSAGKGPTEPEYD